MEYKYDNFFTLKGKKILQIKQLDGETVDFITDGGQFRLYHDQDCCESVDLKRVDGKFEDILNEEIILAEEDTFSDHDPDWFNGDVEYRDSYTWSEYTLKTKDKTLKLFFLGESNGYYSETMTFTKME